jgi:hypothetical protein
MREVFCNRSAIYVSRKNNDLTMFGASNVTNG